MDKMKVKVNSMDEFTRIKLKNAKGETLCYIRYNPNLNTLEIQDTKKQSLRWVPLNERR